MRLGKVMAEVQGALGSPEWVGIAWDEKEGRKFENSSRLRCAELWLAVPPLRCRVISDVEYAIAWVTFHFHVPTSPFRFGYR